MTDTVYLAVKYLAAIIRHHDSKYGSQPVHDPVDAQMYLAVGLSFNIPGTRQQAFNEPIGTADLDAAYNRCAADEVVMDV